MALRRGVIKVLIFAVKFQTQAFYFTDWEKAKCDFDKVEFANLDGRKALCSSRFAAMFPES